MLRWIGHAATHSAQPFRHPCFTLAFGTTVPGLSQTPHARPANSPVSVFTHTFSPVVMYSGTWISMPVSSLAGLVRLVAEAPFNSGADRKSTRLNSSHP